MTVIEKQELEVIEESDKHKITVVEIDHPSFGEYGKKMYKLYIKANDKWFSFRRASYGCGKYFYGLRELQKLAENYNPEEYFFCTHGVGAPLKKFDYNPYPEREDTKALPLEPFTHLENCGSYWSFGGNHRNYSGAFGYKIFSKNLASWVYEILQCENIRAPPDKYISRLYTVELGDITR